MREARSERHDHIAGDDARREHLAQDVPALEPEHPAEGLVDEGQPAVGVAPQDHVGLAVEQIAVARFVLANLPLDILERLEAALEAIADVQEALELGLQVAMGYSRRPGAGSRVQRPFGFAANSEPRTQTAGQLSQWCHAWRFFYCRPLLPGNQSRGH